MLKKCLLLLLTLLLSACFLRNDIHHLSGSYVGELRSINLVPVKTEFLVTLMGAQSGAYAFTESDGKEVKGTLDGFDVLDAQTLLVNWHDPYGSGKLKMKFSNDFSSFSGRWMPKEMTFDIDQLGMAWGGVKK